VSEGHRRSGLATYAKKIFLKAFFAYVAMANLPGQVVRTSLTLLVP
jgi:hypothetical protein